MTRFSILCFTFGLLLAAPAAAQNLPGYSGDYDQAAAQYRAYALGEFQTVLGEWVAAVQDRDPARAARLYSDDVFLHLDQSARGREEAQQALARWIDSLDGFRTGLSDFDASGSLSYGTARIVINAVDPSGDGDGVMTVVMKKHGRQWKIRSQALVME